MENFNQELLEKAKQTKSAEELLALAKENGMELTEEQAKAYYTQFHPVSGELSDDELDNVAGGGCHSKDGRLVVTEGYRCEGWEMNYDKISKESLELYELLGDKPENYYAHTCCICKYLTTEVGMHYCNNPINRS